MLGELPSPDRPELVPLRGIINIPRASPHAVGLFGDSEQVFSPFASYRLAPANYPFRRTTAPVSGLLGSRARGSPMYTDRDGTSLVDQKDMGLNTIRTAAVVPKPSHAHPKEVGAYE